MFKFVFKIMLLTLICSVFGTLFCGVNPSHAATAWQQTNIPYGGSTTVYAIVPTRNQTVYAGTSSGVFKTVNGGASWSAINAGLTNTTVRALAVDPKNQRTIYAGTDDGVFKSVNGGDSWSVVNTGLTTAIKSIYSLAIDPTAPQTIYAGTVGGIFKSVNGGASWDPVSIGLAANVYSVAIDPATPRTVYAGTSNGLCKSVNGGASWGWGWVSTSTNAVAIDPSTTQTVYAGTSDGVFKIVNGGWSWSAVNAGLTNTSIQSLAIDPTNPQTVYAGTSGGVFKSVNGGTSWDAVNTGLTNPSIQSLAIDPTAPQVVYSGTSGGIFKSINGSASWNAVSAGLAGRDAKSLAIDPSTPQTIYAGLLDGGVFKSDNGGLSWINTGLTTTFNITSLVINPTSTQTVYAGTLSGVFKSVNGGTDWSASNTGLTSLSVMILAIDPITPQTIYAGTSGGVFKSVNGGTNWSAGNTGLSSTSIKSLAIDPTTPQTIYAGTSGGVFKSVNGGTSWNPVYTGTNIDVLTIAVDPSHPQVIYAGINGGALVKSINGGSSWNVLNTNGYSSFSAILINPGSSQIIYAVTSTVLVSTDSGATWSKFNPEIPNVVTNISSLAIDPSAAQALYAGTDVGVLKTSPDTNITDKPVNVTNNLSASFSFTSTENLSTFECALDGASFTACTSPTAYTGLLEGSHFFQVRAINAVGNMDVTPESYAWTIDLTPPTVTSLIIPAVSASGTIGVSTFNASDDVALAGYLLTETGDIPAVNLAGWSATAPTSYTFAADGSKILYAWTKDTAGNVSAAKSAVVDINSSGAILFQVSDGINPGSSHQTTTKTYTIAIPDNQPGVILNYRTYSQSRTNGDKNSVMVRLLNKDMTEIVRNVDSYDSATDWGDIPGIMHSIKLPVNLHAGMTLYLEITVHSGDYVNAVDLVEMDKDASAMAFSCNKDYEKIPSKDHTDVLIQNNIWGKANALAVTDCVNDVGWTFNIQNNSNDIISYQEAFYGFKPYDTGSTTTKLPTKLSDIQSVNLAIDFAETADNSAVMNSAVEFWITDSIAPTEASIKAEVMIWLKNQGVTPGGDYYKTVTIGGADYDLYYTSNWTTTHSGSYFAFVRKQPTSSATLPIHEFIVTLRDDPNTNSNLSSDYYLASIEFGNEVVKGSGATTLRTFNVVSKVTDLVPPVVTEFTIQSLSNSLTVPITKITASDTIGGSGLAGYLITETSEIPSATATGWTVSAPTTYTASAAGNITLYAWAMDEAGLVSAGKSATGTINFTVAYDGNGNAGGAVPVDSNGYVTGATVTVLGNTGNLTRTGYTFAGWNTAANGTGASYQPGNTFIMESANVTLYAIWTPTYTVTYDGNGNTGGTVPVDSNSYVTGATVTVLGNTGKLTKSGYIFAGWNTALDNSGANYLPGNTLTMASANVTLYARWAEPVTIKGIVLLPGDITFTQNEDKLQITCTNSTINYTYTVAKGWSAESMPFLNVVIKKDVSGKIATNIELGLDTISALDYTLSTTLSIPCSRSTIYPNDIVDSTLSYKSGKGLRCTPGIIAYNNVTSDLIDHNFSCLLDNPVTYNGNGNWGGTLPVDRNGYVSGATVTVLGNTGNLTRTGYTFAGWNSKADGSGTNYAAGATFTMESANVTLYAQWTPTYTVIYNGNGNTSGTAPVDPNSPYVSGATVTVLGNTGNLTKTGYTFAGWSTAANGSGTNYAAGATFTMESANVTLYAKWTPTYTVIYNGNGNTGGTPPVDGNSPYVSGATVTVLGNTGNLSKTGYTFAGWNTAANGSGTNYAAEATFTMESANVMLYAKWTPTYTVIYNGNGNTGGTPPVDGNSPYVSGATVTVLGNTGNLSKTDYTFAGWSTATNGSGINYQPDDTFIISANVPLYAKWSTTLAPFTFTAQTNVAPSTVVTSSSITVAGINSSAAISITGGTYSINGGAYVGTAGTVSNGATVTVRQTSSASLATTTIATLTIGGVSGGFSVTTQAIDTTPDAFTFTPQTNVAPSTVATSTSITVAGINSSAAISVTGGTYSINGGAYVSTAGTVSNGNTVTVR